MILSVHIPKTAGVSVRNILKEHYGSGFVQYYWQITDAWGQTLENVPSEARCVHGHYQTNVLTGLFPQAELITWVRDPVERVISSYHHRLRDPDWRHPVCVELHEKKLSLEQYAALPLVRNEMTGFFGSKRPEDFLFIGVVEDFELSLLAMKRMLGIPAADVRRDNGNPDKNADFYAIDPRVRRKIERYNESDMSLYEKCLQHFQTTCATLALGAAGGFSAAVSLAG